MQPLSIKQIRLEHELREHQRPRQIQIPLVKLAQLGDRKPVPAPPVVQSQTNGPHGPVDREVNHRKVKQNEPIKAEADLAYEESEHQYWDQHDEESE